MKSQRIYLDNAATTWPKPEAVYQAVDRYMRENGAAAGRGVYREAVEADRVVANARQQIARLINAPSSDCIVFTLNATDALNLAILGLLKQGDRAITSEAEHNSVLRPLHALAQAGVTVDYASQLTDGATDLARLAEIASSPARLIAITHASNVTGAITPLAEVGELAKKSGAFLLVDAAQTAGCVPIDVQQMGISLLAASGHKSLRGPLGTGFLYVAPGLEREIRPLRIGGTGTKSYDAEQPHEMPDRYEAGNLNVPGLAGIVAGIDSIFAEGVENIAAVHLAKIDQLMRPLATMPGVRLYGPPIGTPRAGLVSLIINGYDSRELAGILDANFHIQARAGLHCAPRIHRHLGIPDGGTLRLSVSSFTTNDEIDRMIDAFREITAS